MSDIFAVDDMNTYMNKHWQETEKFLQIPLITEAMDILINNIDIYLREYTMSEALPLHKRIMRKKWWLGHKLHV